MLKFVEENGHIVGAVQVVDDEDGVVDNGMTIDEARRHLDTWSTTHGSGITTDGQHEQAKKIARDIMCKYQKIEQIVNSKTTRLSYEDGFRQIKEVLEDGKID